MTRKTRIYLVKTYDDALKSELGGIGLYYIFGYESDFTGYRILIFNPDTFVFRILDRDDAEKKLEYYSNDPLDLKLEKITILALMKKNNIIIN